MNLYAHRHDCYFFRTEFCNFWKFLPLDSSWRPFSWRTQNDCFFSLVQLIILYRISNKCLHHSTLLVSFARIRTQRYVFLKLLKEWLVYSLTKLFCVTVKEISRTLSSQKRWSDWWMVLTSSDLYTELNGSQDWKEWVSRHRRFLSCEIISQYHVVKSVVL